MRIYLYLMQNKILSFSIPNKISGSFSFDENKEASSKLINIEARGANWVLYSTQDTKVVVNGTEVKEAILESDTYYILKRKDTSYLIFVTNSFENSFASYSYDAKLNLVIGNDSTCNVFYNTNLLHGPVAKIQVAENRIILSISMAVVFINNNALNTTSYVLKNGDTISILGLKIILFYGVLLINNPGGQVKVNPASANISVKSFPTYAPGQEIPVEDVDLYDKEQYFSKAPRLRRVIQTKEIDLSPPPRQEKEEQLPLILTIGPMMTMGVVSSVMVINTISRIQSGTTTLQQSWPQLASSLAMLISMLLWPSLTKIFNKRLKKRKKKELIEKYTEYLNEKRKELTTEAKLQQEILVENLITVEECLKIIQNAKLNFWDKRIEQSDFLEVRLGTGNEFLDVKVNYPEEGFTVEEDELRKQADKMVEEFKYINNVPIGYSLYKNKITALMGNKIKCQALVNNILLQLMTFYSYEDIKFVLFTDEKSKQNWEYLKYLNHTFTNDKSFRFFSANIDDAKKVGDFLNNEFLNRAQLAGDGPMLFKPYYVVIVDDYDSIKHHSFLKNLTEIDANLGFSLLILENHMSKLPSKCNNFITLGENTSGILKNSFEQQEQMMFKDEVNYAIDMMSVAKKLSNIPIEFQEGNRQLPDAVTFLEMEKVGKVEQLNILNRWDKNDSTQSLRAEVGVDEEGNLMYLDLHEKYHGPHGLIAGMTGSGKSEFIITYILSMAINYSPDDVAFILIDYKGGGLAFAFENKTTGVCLPHLAGTITNLDKAEMDRTLVSIDSEIKRRQQLFNEARDLLGESTIDIYKYQRYFKEGKLKEPVPHLFIICDEFAELKSQQPDFMDNLISVARIGRSLGVHLILATQKPSGVVNDQIWSNTKFRVCLKVQDESDSKEMLKRPDAASLKQTGRFYLQVGYDEYFALGQSAWCGAKYYPSETIIKQVDKSVNFIDDTGDFIKSIQAGKQIQVEAKGEQLAAILQNIIEVSKLTNKKVKKLWLNNIEPIILVNDLMKKYAITPALYDVKAIIGEYDAPEKQEQGLLTYSLREDGNTVIYGNDEEEREKLLNTIVYSSCIAHTASEINIYAIDYGSESLRMFHDFPQVGGLVFMGEDEKFKNVFKLIMEQIKERKKLLIPYGGSLEAYNNKNEKKLPYILFILNNYEGILESYNSIYEEVSSIGRDCERYGVILIVTCNTPTTLSRRVAGCFENKYALHLSDTSDYYGIFNMKCRVKPRDTFGRGLVYNDGIHEFQTASITDLDHSVNEYMEKVKDAMKQNNQESAPPIPSLPTKVTKDLVEHEITTMEKVPIGISKETLKLVKYDFTAFTATTIASNKLLYINSFMDSLVEVLAQIQNTLIFFIDTLQILPTIKGKANNVYYFDQDFQAILEKLLEIEKDPKYANFRILYIFYGLERLKSKVDDVKKIENLIQEVKKSEHSNLVFCDSAKGFKTLDFDTWYSSIKNNSDGIWIGKGFSDQATFRISKITKEMSANYPNHYGFYIQEGSASLMKVLEFNDVVSEEEEDDEE